MSEIAVAWPMIAKGDVVMLNLHHAAGDGTAALRLLSSIARAYAGRFDPVPHTMPEEADIPAPSGRCAQLRALVGEFCQAAPRSVHLVPSGGEDRPGRYLTTLDHLSLTFTTDPLRPSTAAPSASERPRSR